MYTLAYYFTYIFQPKDLISQLKPFAIFKRPFATCGEYWASLIKIINYCNTLKRLLKVVNMKSGPNCKQKVVI